MNNYTDYDAAYAALGGGIIVIWVLILAILIVGLVANWKMFRKAGKQGWECIIPFYGYWVLVEIAGLNWWWCLLIFADSIVEMVNLKELSTIANLASLFASFNCYYNIAKRFNKNTGTSVCAGIFSYIFILIFGFSKNEVYDTSIPVSANGIFGHPVNNSYQNNNVNQSTNSVDMNTNVANNNVNTNGYTHSFCGNCGTKLENNVRFCPNCGREKK